MKHQLECSTNKFKQKINNKISERVANFTLKHNIPLMSLRDHPVSHLTPQLSAVKGKHNENHTADISKMDDYVVKNPGKQRKSI